MGFTSKTEHRDTLGVAHLLAAALKAESPDLILTGLQSDDLGYGQTGVVLAELLGLPSSTIIMQVEMNQINPAKSASNASWRTAGSSTSRCLCPLC